LPDKTFNFEKWEGDLCRPYTFIRQINDSLFLLKADMREYTEIELVNPGRTARRRFTRLPSRTAGKALTALTKSAEEVRSIASFAANEPDLSHRLFCFCPGIFGQEIEIPFA
jgi:hypothetical protein